MRRRPSFKTLDQEVQGLKKDVVDLNKDLFVLEEELLFPANTQVAVYVSMDVGTFFALDSVTLKIDNKEVKNYLYTAREADALLKGGVQQLYLGNLKVGKHELVAFFYGKGPVERDYKRGATISFDKGVGAKYLELKITDRVRQASTRVHDQRLGMMCGRDSRLRPFRPRRIAAGVPVAGLAGKERQAGSRRTGAASTCRICTTATCCSISFQDDYFDSITRLLAARQLERLPHTQEEAELLLGGLYLSLGEHVEAGKIFEALLTENTSEAVRNKAWFYLGKVWYQRGYLEESERALRQVSDENRPAHQRGALHAAGAADAAPGPLR